MRLTALLLVLIPGAARADLAVFPAAVALNHAQATQPLIVADVVNGRTVADRTASAKFQSSDAKVATVDADGTVRPVADGSATITATVGTAKAAATVRVSGTKSAFAWSFTNHVEPTLTRAGCNSGACHGALAGKGGLKLSLRAFDPETDHFVLTRQALARRIDREEPAKSLMVNKATRELPHGGGRRFALDSSHAQILLDWIRAGAPGPKADEPTLAKIELFPPPALLAPKDKFRILVRGTYSDGSMADVTPWVRFASTADLVAGVDEDGKVSVGAAGEAAITATVGTKIAALTVTVPFPAAKVETGASANFIDDHVHAKLRELNLPPSERCTDSEFVRRAYLDACGVLPKPEEAAAFLADASPNKRAKLIDALLERPEFTDYWAHKWSDLLLVSSRKLPQPAMWAFYRAVRQAVAENVPWDRFARGVVTASGSTLANGPANYFAMHKEVTELVESTTVTFLGTSINCCRCHNHPLEKWTQDQYWGMANLFGRVGVKNGESANELVVLTRSEGDAFHLRRGIPMPPTPLGGKPMPADSVQDRREYLADWLTAADNPYFAKALVNRVWKNFLGRGLVEAEDDLRDSNPPTNPLLFDALAREFIAKKYDVKQLMRTIMNSATYQRSAKPTSENAADDRFYARYYVRRLSAEVILDAQADVLGVPTAFTQVALGASGGFANSTSFPAGTRAVQLPDSLLVSQFLDAFGRAERGQTCACEKTTDSSVTQALHLNNGTTLNAKLKDAKSRAATLATTADDAAVVAQIFRLALSREPTVAEKSRLVAALADATKAGVAARREAVEDLFWAVLTSQEFLFNR